MRMMWLAAAALAVISLPTQAPGQSFTGSAFTGGAFAGGSFASRTDRPRFVAPPSPGDCRDFRRGGHHGHRDRGFGCGGFGGWAYADSGWAVTNNRSWDSDSYNDWWHDRPDRAFPRWVQEQRGGTCSEDRMWWSGAGWHC
jgi:hypothetical protein